jgi:protein TonB
MALTDAVCRIQRERPRDLVLTVLGGPRRGLRAGEAAASASLHAAAIAAALVASGFGFEAPPELKPPPLFVPVMAVAPPPPPRGVAVPARAVRARPRPVASTPRAPAETPQQLPATAPLDLETTLSPERTGEGDGHSIGDSVGDRSGTTGGLPGAPPFPVASPPPAEPVRIVDLRQARLVERVAPEFPPLARAAGLSGRVVLDALVGPDGRVVSVEVTQGHRIFDSAAREAVLRWRYEPLLLNGAPTPFRLTVTVNFQLR